MHVCFQKNREFWAIMSAFTWKELALADAVATKDLIDKKGVHSHKVLELTFRQKVNPILLKLLKKEYLDTLKHFKISTVDYLPRQKFTNLGVFALSDIDAGCEIPLIGFLAEIREEDSFPEDANVSVFQRKDEELMLGPLSFVNHSCFPNCSYISSQSDRISLKTLRSFKKHEKITVKYGPKYFGDYNVDCLCPHVEFHGKGTLVLSSRTRSAAKRSGEKGSLIVEDVTNKASRYNQRVREPDFTCNPTTSASDRYDESLMRVSGRYFTSRGKKFRTASTYTTVPLVNSSLESDSVSCDEVEQSILEQNVTHDRSPTDEVTIKSQECLLAQTVRCSTPLHLSSFLEFTLPQEPDSFDQSESSSDEEIFLHEYSDVTVAHFEKVVLDFVVRHKLADNAARELFKLFKLVLPKPNFVPTSLGHRKSKKVKDGFEVLNFREQEIKVMSVMRMFCPKRVL